MDVATIITTGDFSFNAFHCLDEKYKEHHVAEAGSVSRLGRSKGTVTEIFIINMFLLDL